MHTKTEQIHNKGAQEKAKIVDLDTILVEEIGQFGLYQWKIWALCVLMVIFASWGGVEYVFTTSRIASRCLIPECDENESPEYRPDWILRAVPGDSLTSFDNCRRFTNVSSESSSFFDACPASLFNRSEIITCDQYVYASTDTIVYDFDLACDEWRRSLVGSLYILGVLTAMPITGFVSDRWGRRVALAISAFNTAWLGIVRYWASTYIGFLFSEFVEAMLGSGSFSCAYILLMEITGPKYRVPVGATMNSAFSIGQIFLGLIAWAVPNWKKLTLTLYIPQLITISYFWIMSESVRWYLSKGRYEEAQTVLKEVARLNRKKLSESSLEALRQNAEEERKKKEMVELSKTKEPWLIVLVFQNKKILLRCMVSPIWWITNTIVYYGLTINAVNIAGHRYLNYIAVAAADIPGYWTAVILMGKIGRKPVLILAFWVCAACQIGYILLPSGIYAVSLTLYLIGKFCIAMVMTAIYVYTSELYPTKYRHSLFAFSSMMGRFGAILAPLTPAFGAASGWEDLPFALFGGFALVSGLLVFVTPETLGSKLPDTMEDAADIGK